MTDRVVCSVWVGGAGLLTAMLVATVGFLPHVFGMAGVVLASAASATCAYDLTAHGD